MVIFTRILLFLNVLTNSASDECHYGRAMPNFQKSVFDFTLKLVSRINEKIEGNFVTSALCPWTLLLVMSLGGSEASRQEIRDVLELPSETCFIYLYIELMHQVTIKPNNPSSSKLERSSTIFFDSSEYINKSFFDALYKAGIYSSHITYFQRYHNESAHSINERVRILTDDVITNIVTAEDLIGLATLTIDASTLKGAWKVSFPYEDIQTSAFYDDGGEQIGHVTLMYQSESFKVINVSEINATVLELPYHGDPIRYALLIFLPSQNASLTTMLDLMQQPDIINISTIFQMYEQAKPEKVTVQLPKFNIHSMLDNWKELLFSIGINSVLEDREATIPGVSYYKLLTNFIQKTKLEVGEEGLYGGRASVTLMQSRFQYDQFVANRPFLFMVVDKIQRVPLITGAYSKPIICDN